MIFHSEISSDRLQALIKKHKITLAGNQKLKIYGRLDCKSGMRMLKENRVFFSTELEALERGFRPCGHCCKVRYQEWKYSQD